MEKKMTVSLVRCLRENTLLLVSTAAALALFARRSKLMLLLEAAMFAAVALMCWLDRDRDSHRELNRVSTVPALLFAGVGAANFCMNWGGAKALLAALPLAFLAFYAFSRLCGRLDSALCHAFGLTEEASAIRRNWWLPLSAGAFFLTASRGLNTPEYALGIPAAVGVSWVFACRMPPIAPMARREKGLWALAAVAAAGICLFQWTGWPEAPGVTAMEAVLAFPAVWLAVGALYRLLKVVLCQAFETVTRRERWAYAAVAVLLLVGMALLFSRSDAFYGTSNQHGTAPFDVIYTSDSCSLVPRNAYMWLNFAENDLRQPLFAVFAGPLVAPFWLLGRVLRASPSGMAILLNIPQVLALLAGCVMLAGALELTGWKRGLFLALCCASYPVALFSVMMEQYVIGFFYLTALIFGYCRGRRDHLIYWGVGGTLLTGAVLAPLLPRGSLRREPESWLRELIETVVLFGAAMVLFGRLEILLNAGDSLIALSRFAGAKLTLLEKARQYSYFWKNCFLAPYAQVEINRYGNISWQLLPPERFSLLGIAIAAFAVFGAAMNWDKKIARVSAAYLGLSALVLLILGWGTQENGLILYALYFGWALWVLCWQGWEALGRLTRQSWLPWCGQGAMLVLLLVYNIPEMLRLIEFAVQNYGL